MVLACLNIASTAAFGAFIALSSMGLFVSYLLTIGCMFHARFRSEPIQFGEWNMGKLGLLVNAFAILYTAYVTIWFPFPSSLPVTGTNMNYPLPIFSATTLFALGLWVFWARKRWPGLNADVVRLVVEDGALEFK
jgi:choline transport protein